jgi:hypothetical protein
LIFYSGGTGYDLANYVLPVTLTVNPGVSPQLTYIPNTNYNSLLGSESFGYTLADRAFLPPTSPDQPIPETITLNVTAVNQPPSFTGQTNGVTVHQDTNGIVTQDAAIDSLGVADDASETPGATIYILVQATGIQSGDVYAATGVKGVTVTIGRGGALKLEGTIAALNNFIATSHIFYHPAGNSAATQLEVTADDEGNTGPGGVAGTPLETTVYLPVHYATP